jgi:hypothetical protein
METIELMIFPLSPLCDGLVDQKRFIGSDPVGHGCSNKAVVITDYSHALCLECEGLLGTGRITLPPKRFRLAKFNA